MIRDLWRWTLADLGVEDLRLSREDLAAGLGFLGGIVAVWFWLVVAA